MFITETYFYEVDMIINESKIDLKSKFIKLLKLVLKKGYKYRRKILVYGLASLITLAGVSKVSALFNNDNDIQKMSMDAGISDIIEEELSKTETDTTYTLDDARKSQTKVPEKNTSLRPWSMEQSPANLTVSQKGWDYIRHEEGDVKRKGYPVLKAYSIGDGMITIGWGHAEKARKSQFKVGDEITKDEAQELLKKDLTKAANGVRRILTEWDNKGIDIEISQDQFDVLVSLAYNSGIGSLRRSPILKHMKKGNFEKAGQKLKSWRVSKKFPGLQTRRDKEYTWFMSYKTFS